MADNPSSSTTSESFSWPLDVIYSEILPRLPVKSLVRFKCVSNSFKDLISSPVFIQLYLRQYFTPNANCLLILPSDRSIVAYDLDAPDPATATSTFSWSASDGAIRIIGSCNGLLCIVRDSSWGSPLVLLNPSTRICWDIEMPITDSGKFFGFGFDDRNLDYKIVAVADVLNKRAVKTRVTWIYSVNTKFWRVAQTVLSDESMLGSYAGVLISGHLLHWMFWCPSTRKRRIGCFDVRGEVWKEDVLLPHYYYEAGRKVNLFDFGVVDGCLFSLFENKVERDRSDVCFYDVWVMTEYGVQDSWFQLFSIPFSEQLEGGVIPIAISRVTGEVLLRKRHRMKLFWYNWIDSMLTDAAFPKALYFSDRQAFICQRSLVSLPDGRWPSNVGIHKDLVKNY